MATKMIKFDLPMKGVKVTSFEELQENFSADILPIFQAGRLSKWLMSRELVAQSEAIAAIDKNSTELLQLVAICRVLELDDDEEVLQILLDDRQAVQPPMQPPVETEVELESNNVNSIENEVIIPEARKKSLMSMLEESESEFKKAKDCGLIFGFDLIVNKGPKKSENAEKSYANRGGGDSDGNYKIPPMGNLLMLYDSTVWGSGSEGFCITSDEFFCKASYEDGYMVNIRDIKTFRVDEDDREISVNGNYYKYRNGDLTKSLKIISKCIEKYNQQFIFVK